MNDERLNMIAKELIESGKVDEILKVWKARYEEKLREELPIHPATSNIAYARAKRTAAAYADKAFELIPLQKFAAAFGRSKSVKSYAGLLGQKLVIARAPIGKEMRAKLRQARLRAHASKAVIEEAEKLQSIREKLVPTEKDEVGYPEAKTPVYKRGTAQKLLEEFIPKDRAILVPHDKTLAYFAGGHPTTWSRARVALCEKGYRCEDTNCGHLMQAPQPEPVIEKAKTIEVDGTEITVDEFKQMLELVKKFADAL